MAPAALSIRPLSVRPLVPGRRVVPHAPGGASRLMLVREVAPPYGAERALADDGDATDLDHIEELGDAIATLSAHIEAATHRLLVLIAEFDERRGWETSGQKSCAHWLAFRTGLDLGAARERVRTARVLVGLPEISAAMARGELSFSKVRALSRVATTDNERDLLELARGCTSAQLERVVRGWKRAGTRRDEAALERERHEARTLSVFPDLDGMYVVRGKLPPELGVLLMRAIEAASDHIFREQPVEALETEQAAAQRRADALALLAERALSAGLGDAPVSGTRAERYQVVLHVDEPTLQAEGEPGRSELTTAPAFPRKRPGGSPATRGSCACGTHPTGTCSTSGGGPAPSRPRSAARSRRATEDAASPAAARGLPTAITCATGPTEARPASGTRCYSAGTITRSCTRAAGPSSGGATRAACVLRAARSDRLRRAVAAARPARRSRRSARRRAPYARHPARLVDRRGAVEERGGHPARGVARGGRGDDYLLTLPEPGEGSTEVGP